MMIKSYTCPINYFRLEILENGLLYGDRYWNFSNITSPFNRLYFVLEGEGVVENKNHQVLLQPGNVYLIPPKAMYSYRCSEKLHKLYLHFNLNFLPGTDVFENLGECIDLSYPVEESQELVALLESNTLPDLFKFKTRIEELLSSFLDKSSQNYQLQWKYEVYSKYIKLLELIQSNLTADMKISQLAESLNYSCHSLSRNFKQDTGIGLDAFIQNMLVTKAKQLLLTSDLSIGEIAAELHFCDQYYFSRFFKKHVHIPPREYRRRNTLAIAPDSQSSK